jgi:cytoskeletal protein CcmA (bactofilin family)
MKAGSHLKGLQGMGSVFGVATRIEGTVRIEESVRIDGTIGVRQQRRKREY